MRPTPRRRRVPASLPIFPCSAPRSGGGPPPWPVEMPREATGSQPPYQPPAASAATSAATRIAAAAARAAEKHAEVERRAAIAFLEKQNKVLKRLILIKERDALRKHTTPFATHVARTVEPLAHPVMPFIPRVQTLDYDSDDEEAAARVQQRRTVSAAPRAVQPSPARPVLPPPPHVRPTHASSDEDSSEYDYDDSPPKPSGLPPPSPTPTT